MSWIDYWSDTSFDAEFWRRSMEFFAENLQRHVPLLPDLRVLDFGAGPGFLAPALAGRVGSLCLAEPSPVLREYARRHFAQLPGVAIPDVASNEVPAGPFDLIVVNSVIHYLPAPASRAALLLLAHELAGPGRIVVSDIVPRGSFYLAELWSVFRRYMEWTGIHGFARHAARELLRSPRRLRLSVQRFDHAGFEQLVAPELEVSWIEGLTICRNRHAALLSRPERT